VSQSYRGRSGSTETKSSKSLRIIGIVFGYSDLLVYSTPNSFCYHILPVILEESDIAASISTYFILHHLVLEFINISQRVCKVIKTQLAEMNLIRLF